MLPYTLYFITVLVVNCENVQLVFIETVLRDSQTGFLLPHRCTLELDAGKVLLWSLVKYPLNDKNLIAVLTFLISFLWLDRVREGSGGREDESVGRLHEAAACK